MEKGSEGPLIQERVNSDVYLRCLKPGPCPTSIHAELSEHTMNVLLIHFKLENCEKLVPCQTAVDVLCQLHSFVAPPVVVALSSNKASLGTGTFVTVLKSSVRNTTQSVQ
ncbi:hypothetical protein J6590_057614 [Homalodisca vitripennis]|nr:hypothetical protein J6590_057614 [Homalodisca vitripennis]